MSVAQKASLKKQGDFVVEDTGLSPHTPTLKTLGKIAGDAYHARRLDDCPN